MKRFSFLSLALALAASTSVAQEPTPDLDKLRQLPITTDAGKVGMLLKQWWAEGTASGNAGDFYDNRDGDHSPLDLKRYPQLSAVKYSDEDVKLRKHWAAARIVRPQVTFGNSSTSAPAHLGGSNPRSNYVSQLGLSLLYDQYTKNNLYIYPEHRDHDPGHNGVFFLPNGTREEGYGDMYPTNTPYLIISQGSSGSDQPFMRMMPHVLAAFRPEVKKKLTETGLLMPTIQMLMRSTNKHLKDPKEYLTGKAHPSVFEGSWVDELAMVQKAHAMELKSLPPMVQMRVLEESKAENGVDFFDRNPSEVIANTPACIARVHRSKAQIRHLIVDAGASYDVNKAKLTYTWVVLRGDPDKVKITPRRDDQSLVEITIAWHERRPVSPGSPLESNRVDIGLFVHNGTYYSAPGFVTMCTLDREARVYSKEGKILAIAHGLGTTEMRVKDWAKLCAHLGTNADAAKLVSLDDDQRQACSQVGMQLTRLDGLARLRRTSVQSYEATLKDAKTPEDKKKAQSDLDAERKVLKGYEKEIDEWLGRKDDALKDSPRVCIDSRLSALSRDALFTQNQLAWLKKNRTAANEARIKSLWKKMASLGIANDKEVLTALLPGKTLADTNWTPFERAQLEWLHASLLAEIAFPGMIDVIWRTNYVDHRLSAPREWYDFYRHDVKGEYIGWMRYSSEGVQLFNHEGLLVIDKDLQMRCIKGRTVRYVQDAPKAKSINVNPLRMVLGDTIVRYEFDGKDDMRGRRVSTETVKDKQ
ncbi:MAG: hypothetical protein HY289_09785 [Planctomycetes bacterium]|nr:hypothetical protein [Planctomycetota bacterium]